MSERLASKVSKLAPSDFIELLNAAIHNPVQDVQFLLSQIGNNGESLVKFADEAAWGRERRRNNIANGAPFISDIIGESRALFPLRLNHAKTYHSDRTVLIGDAAHTIHPLAGQGLNLGLADAECLARHLLKGMSTGEDLGILRCTNIRFS
jgi:ubiquinone biosynthesis monooxygenase Coq6